MAGVRRLDHVGIVVRSVERAIPRYRDLLELELDLIDEVEAPPVRLAYLRSPSSMEPIDVQLVEPTGPGAIADYLEGHGEGLHHLCFQVEDIASALRNIPGEERTAVFTGGRQRPACFLTTRLTGILVELTQVPMG